MAKNHGAKQQKKVAKLKAKRAEKRTELSRRTSNDPTIRLQRAAKWPVVQSMVGENLWNEGIGYLAIARQDAGGQLIFGVYLVDVYCLGVKDAFWKASTPSEFKEVIEKMSTMQRMVPIAPACLVKIVKAAVEFALSYGFKPYPDFHHAARLLEGIDPETCTQEFHFGREGKPCYIQGPYESFERAAAIMSRLGEAAGNTGRVLPALDFEKYDSLEEEDAFEDEDDLALPAP